jgi:hypothetical protein
MTPSRVLPLVLALAVLPFGPAAAQFGGMPGMPGSPGMSPGMGPAPGASPFSAPAQQPPEACKQLLVNRDETQKHGLALQAAGKKKAPPEELCKLFKVFLAAETKMVKGIEDNSSTCGVPPELVKQLKDQHNRASTMGKQVCEAAAQGPRPAGPSLSDALGTTPPVPESNSAKKGVGTFETLSGTNPLQR